jgi:subtilisin family serine protease
MNDTQRARLLRRLLAAVAVYALAGPAGAQLGGLGGRFGGALGPLGQGPGRITSGLEHALDPETLLSVRLDRLDAQVRAHPQELDRDYRGDPVVRSELLVIAPSEAALIKARSAGFALKSREDDGLGLAVLTTPPGVSARDGVKRLRRLDPDGVYDFNHIYGQSGPTGPVHGKPGAAYMARLEPSVCVGLIDSGVDAGSPVFTRAGLEQRNFVGTAPRPALHGTAVASLLVGEAPLFAGSAPGGTLYAADVYGGAATGGAADAIIRALSWMVAKRVAVVNVSLVGPPNLALAAAVRAAQARNVAVVAAVGNDGPAAPPAYPASYPGVIAVTGVDAHGRVLLEAGRAEHLDFAAPGADMAAAAWGGGYLAVRGALLARGHSLLEAEEVLTREGRKGRGYGRALVAEGLRTPPAKVRTAAELKFD